MTSPSPANPTSTAVARLEQCAEWLRIARVRVVGESTEEHLKEFDYIADVIFEVIIALRSVPVPAPHQGLLLSVEYADTLDQLKNAHCDVQFALATALAANVGYVLTLEPVIDRPVPAPGVTVTDARVQALEDEISRQAATIEQLQLALGPSSPLPLLNDSRPAPKAERNYEQEFAEHERRIRAGEILCDYCNIKLYIPVCPRCGNTQANIHPRDRAALSAALRPKE